MTKAMAKQQGVALLLVLMLTAIISVVIVGMQYKTKTLVEQVGQAKYRLIAQAQVEGFREELTYLLTTTPIWLFKPTPEFIAQHNLPEGFNLYGKKFKWHGVDVELTDASGLVSLIPFNERSWRLLLNHVGAKNTEHIIAAMKDWYDTDDFLHLHGAEKDDYDVVGFPRNHFPQYISELQYVKGMTPEIWRKIEPWLVYIGQDELNYDYSPASMLPMILGDYRAQELLEIRSGESPLNINVDMTKMASETGSTAPTNQLLVTASRTENNAGYKESYVLVKSRGNPKNIYVSQWRPGFLGDSSQ